MHVTHRFLHPHASPTRHVACFDLRVEFTCPSWAQEGKKKEEKSKCIDCCNWRNAVVSSARTDNSVHTI